MNYCGNYNSGTSYSVGDIAIYTDGVPYILLKAAPAGTSCHDTLYWNRVQPPLADALVAIHGAVNTLFDNLNSEGEAITDLSKVIIDDKTIVLASSTEDSEKKFAITVDDDGDISATEIEEPAEENAGE